MRPSDILSMAISLAVGVPGALAGAAASAGENRVALSLIGLSGVCAIFGALFYASKQVPRANAKFDLLVNFAFAFILGASAGPVVGMSAFKLLPGLDESYLPHFAPHMLGGALVGALSTAAFHAALIRIAKLGGDK